MGIREVARTLLDSVWRPAQSEQRSISWADFPALNSLFNPPSTAGVTVTEATALNFSAYFNGVDIISSQVAKLPRKVYRKSGDDERETADKHPAYRLLHDAPNEYQIPFVFWQTLMAHVLTWGNGYAEIEWDRAGRPLSLSTILPNEMQACYGPTTIAGKPYHGLHYSWRSGQATLHPSDVLHVPGLGFDGMKGYSVVSMARRSIGLGLAAETFGASFFGNGAWPGLVLEHPGTLSDGAQKRLLAQHNSEHQGPDRANKTKILEEGMKAQKIGIPPDDAQFLESREFQVVEMARWLNLPPHKLKHKYGERPGGNLEAGQIEFLTDTLDPWLVRIEQECTRKLLSGSGLYVEHETNAVLRLDSTARAASYKAYFDMGVMDAEQIARRENLPKPKPKKEPPAPVIVAPPEEGPMPDPGMADAARALLVDVVSRYARREAEQARRAAKRGPEALEMWCSDLAGVEVPILVGMLGPALRVIWSGRGDVSSAVECIAREYLLGSREALLSLPARDIEEATSRVVTGWQPSRSLAMAEKIMRSTPDDWRT
jgi:HK97 family phage portal protein